MDPSDGTTYDPLVITDAYLLNYSEKATNEPEAPVDGGDNGDADGEFPVLPVAIAAAAVVVIAAVAVVVLKKKK